MWGNEIFFEHIDDHTIKHGFDIDGHDLSLSGERRNIAASIIRVDARNELPVMRWRIGTRADWVSALSVFASRQRSPVEEGLVGFASIFFHRGLLRAVSVIRPITLWARHPVFVA